MNDINHLTRREFLRYAAGLGLSASSIALLSSCGIVPPVPAAEPRLETTKIRIGTILKNYAACAAYIYLAQPFLEAEGFTDVEYVDTVGGSKTLSASDFDVTGLETAVSGIARIDRGEQITMLSGAHVGCFDALGNDQVHTIRDLKGKTIAVNALGGHDHAFMTSMIAYVGVNPNKDINWVVLSPDEATQRLNKGTVDALIAFTPRSMELRANKIGHEIFNSRFDKPWSQYFSCMMAGNRDFVRKNPVATKRWLRATLRGSDIANQQPERAARFMVDAGHNSNYDHVLQAMKELPSGVWREYDPEDTLRFYALRLNEVGMIKSSPNDIIARGTDFRFLNDLKKEMKG